VDIISREIPTPKAGQVLVKVEVAGQNPKDWKM
jgi:NADPH:quinone reductase-like Zn-dependent oxidoreductase